MPPIYLSIRENYCPNWSGEHPGHPLGWCGFRELAQNLVDAKAEFGGAAYIRQTGNTVSFINEGQVLEHRALLLGYTTKTDKNMIGQWGEGLKVGALALLRDGYKINIRTGKESWTPAIEEAPQFGGERVLAFHIRKLADSYFHGVDIRVQGVSREVWREVQRRCLILPESRPEPGLMISTSKGDVLLDRDGEIYVKGLFVEKSGDLRFGFNFTSGVELDRDRSTVKYWDMRVASGNLLLEALRLKPELNQVIFQLLEEGKRDVSLFEYQTPANLTPEIQRGLSSRWRTLYGEKTIPAASLEDCQRLERVGYQGRVVQPHMINALQDVIPSVDVVIREAARSIQKTYSWPEFTPEEQQVITRARELLERAGLLVDYKVVDFLDEGLLGQYTPEVLISRRVCSNLLDFLVTFIHETAHEEGGDLVTAHTAAIEKKMKKLLGNLIGE